MERAMQDHEVHHAHHGGANKESKNHIGPAVEHDGSSTHRGNLSDPHDLDHQAIVESERSARGAHDKHAGHSVETFRARFWLSLLLSIPVVLFSEMVQDWFNFSMPSFPGSGWIAPVLGAAV